MHATTLTLDAERIAKGAFITLTNVIDAFRSWKGRRQAGKKAQAEREVNSRFDIEHRDGRMFLTCQGTAFSEIDGGCTVEQAAALLRAAQQNANRFKSLNRY